eukprot:360817-Chlamydomonas_euryale.AAC.4
MHSAHTIICRYEREACSTARATLYATDERRAPSVQQRSSARSLGQQAHLAPPRIAELKGQAAQNGRPAARPFCSVQPLGQQAYLAPPRLVELKGQAAFDAVAERRTLLAKQRA